MVINNNQKEVSNQMGEIPITLFQYSCERCGNVWIPRKMDKPRVCPSCKSAYWDLPRRSSELTAK
jgi:predicted Zn-ribbon and HTH transcriptional regulator